MMECGSYLLDINPYTEQEEQCIVVLERYLLALYSQVAGATESQNL
jgi:hypothetical protein